MSAVSVWERERVLALAPQPSARTAARELATPRRWSSTGATSRAVWGRCQGSAGSPYETVVLLGEPSAYACSCPSRRSPCKHCLGLLLLWSAGDVPAQTVEPDFVVARLERRTKGSPAPGSQGQLADPAAAARRTAARAERVAAGLDDLDLWLRDQIRGGLAPLERTGYAPFERMAARMVDAQAPGVAGMLRSMPADLRGEGWPERLLRRFAALHLLIEGHRRLAELPPELADNVRSHVGYPVTRAQVLQSPGVPDRWLALGLVDTVDDQLESRRVWLYGTTSGRWAVTLSFAVPGAELETTVLPGQQIDAPLHFYPGSSFRALIGDGVAAAGKITGVASGSLKAARRRFAALLALDPWASRLPAVVVGAPIRPAEPGRSWRLRDVDGHCVDLIGLTAEPWPLLARSGGELIEVFGEWGATGFRPLSVLPDAWGPYSIGIVW